LGIAAVFLVAGTAMAAQGGGRPLRVDGIRVLNFGTVLPGVAGVVSRLDPVNSGQFDLRGEKFAQVELTFMLPVQMTGPAGAVLPLVFGASDAGFSEAQAITSQVGFDPTQPFLARLSQNGRGSVFLGATVSPLPGQRAGSYTATVTLTVAYTGL
jgi:hypothetical protein